MNIKTLNPIEQVGNKVTINLNVTASNDDWIRASRLKNSTKKEDQQEYEKMDNTMMIFTD